MNIMIAPKMVEPDTVQPDARARSRTATGGAFEGEMKDVARRAEDAPAETAPQTEAEGEAAPGPQANVREVIGWLASPARDMASETAAGQTADLEPTRAQPSDSSRSALEASIEGSEPADPLAPKPNLSRLVVTHQETHFEPTLHEPEIVAAKATVEPDRPGRGGELLQLLSGSAARPDRAGTAPAAETGSSLPMLAMAVGERAGRRTDAGADRSAIVREPDAEPSLGPVPADERRTEKPRNAERFERDVQMSAVRAERAAAREGERAATPIAASAATISGEPAPMARQIAERIIDAFPAPAGRPLGEPGAAEAHLRLRAGGAAMRTLTIRLEPEHLGTLEVSMRLRDGQLTLEMAADRSETARALSEDRSLIRTILEKAGFSLDDAAISVVARDGAQGASLVQPSREGADAGGRGERQGDPQAYNGERGGGGGSQENERPRPAAERSETAPRRPASSVFL